MKGLRALIVDDDKNIRTTVGVCLQELGCDVSSAGSVEEAAAAIGRGRYDVAFLDLQLGAGSGLDLLPKLLAASPTAEVVVITAFVAVDTAVEAMRRGAADYLPKPFTPAQIEHVLSRISHERNLRQRAGERKARPHEPFPEPAPAAADGPRVGGPHTVEEVERAHIEHVLSTAPSLEAAASILGINASTLWRKRKKYAQ